MALWNTQIMIDLAVEHVVSLTEAATHLPRRRTGKRPHVATLYRWAARGMRGVKLETIRVGGTLCTSLEALQRFCARLTDPTAPPEERSSVERTHAVESAEEQLDALGF